MKHIVYILFAIAFSSAVSAQTVKTLTSGTKTSLRGLSPVSDNVIWASGSGGMVAKTVDAGATWKWFTVKGFEKTEFRDIEAFDSSTAIIMAIAEPAFILKTTDGGINWKEVYRNDTKGMFLDAMDFWDDKNGMVIGDPINGKVFIAKTTDGGNTWKEAPDQPVADSGEAFFASSGTNIRMINKKKAVFVSGGLSSHIFRKDGTLLLPMLQGKESTGANSIAVKNRRMMIVVGGDFNTKDSTVKNCFISNDGGNTWREPQTKPTGYRSCIEFWGDNSWVTCGLSGVDFSSDDGSNFTRINSGSFHVCKRSKTGKNVFLAGSNGKISVIFPSFTK